MKYSVGYQLRASNDWIDAILRQTQHLCEVYFAWPGFANGRSETGCSAEFSPWDAQKRTQEQLLQIAHNGLCTNLLLNAMCYGEDSQSRAFFCRVGETLDYAVSHLNTRSVTTTSPLVARFVHDNFPGVEVRASINMEIGSVRAMETVCSFFDGFYLKRELNRCPQAIERMKAWCDSSGKQLYFLANSGCIADCAMHVFHDNLVAHEKEIVRMDNAYDFQGVCWERLKNPQGAHSYLENATFVRPEDIHLYEKWFPCAKLATRVNRDPVRVLNAYLKGSFRGSLPSLMEPNHEGALSPALLENSRLPKDFGRQVMNCGQHCDTCDYCERAFDGALIHLNGDDLIC